MERAQTAKNAGTPNNAANIAVLFFIYAYSPCYNMGYNALTYSELARLSLKCSRFWSRTCTDPDLQPTWSKSGRTPSAPKALPSSSCLAVSRAFSPLLSIPSASPVSAGDISSRTAAGSPLKFASSTSCSPRHRDGRLRS
jgi:hypothetical protein